jgi:hypothetical protein
MAVDIVQHFLVFKLFWFIKTVLLNTEWLLEVEHLFNACLHLLQKVNSAN